MRFKRSGFPHHRCRADVVLSDLVASTIIVHLKAKDSDAADKIAWKLIDAASHYRKDKEQLYVPVSVSPLPPLPVLPSKVLTPHFLPAAAAGSFIGLSSLSRFPSFDW